MSKHPAMGDTIPQFKVKDFDGEVVTTDDLIGSPFIVYFYPKDDTPGCTDQACQFRDIMDVFDDLDILVIGVSPDSAESHRKFIEKHELNFPLLCDEKLEMAKAFGAVKTEADGSVSIVRSTFLCDDEGVIQWLEMPVKVENHAERVVKAIEDLFE